MATLNNTRISDTYFGLIKTIDNAVISATLKELSDGSGNATGLSINNAGDFKVNAILEFGSLKDTGENIVISKFVDAADGIGNNNNDTSIPTTKAIIDYVAAQITAEDLDFRGDDSSVLGDVDLNSEAFIILGTANEIQTAVTAAGGNTIQIGLPNNVTITSDLSAVNLNASSLLTTLDMRLKGSINVLNKAGNNYQAFAQRDVSGSTALINLNNIGSIGASGTITAPTFSGQLSGTISSATTATTQSAGDNSTKVATTAYVDSLDAGSDLDFSGDSGTGAVVLNTETLAVTGTTNQIETTATGTGLNLKFPTGGVVLPNGSTATTQLSSDSSTKVATTAYVKGLDNASDLDITDGTTAGDVNLNTQSLSILGTAQQVTSTVSNQSVTLSLPSSINVNSASATILQTARDISLTGEASGTISSFNGSSNVSGAVTLDNNSVTGKVLTGLAAPTATNILASDTILQAFGKAQSQINTLAGGLRFMGTWNATTNSPTLASGGGEADSGTTTGTATNKLIQSSQNFTSTVTNGDQVVNQASGATALVTNVDSNTQLTLDADIMVSGQEYTIDNSPFITQGHYFVVSVGGTSSLNGLSNWAVGDWVIAGANNTWEKLDHTQVDGTGTTGNITKWESTNVIADSIMAESGSTISVTGSLSTSQLLSSGGNFAVNTNKFTVDATTGNVVTTGDVSLVDSKQLKLGNSADLLIFHDGADSYIKDTGSGLLFIRASSALRIQGANGESMIDANENGAVNLYYDNSIKLATTSTGITISNVGATSAASSTVDEFKVGSFGAGRPAIFFGTSNSTYTNSTWFIENRGADGKLVIGRNGLDAINILNSGDFGIGASPSDGNFQVKKAGVNTGITNVLMNASFSEAGGSLSGLSIGYRTDETTAVLAARTATGNISFMSYDGGWSESFRIANTGISTFTNNVSLIKNSSSTGSSASPKLLIYNEGAGDSALQLSVSGSIDYYLGVDNSDDKFKIGGSSWDSSPYLTIDTSGNSTFAGNVGIGITPSASFSGVEVLQLGKGMSIFGNTNDDRATMASNLILNTGTAFEYVMDGLAGKFSIEDGNMSFGTAPFGNAGSVATITERFAIANTGAATFTGNVKIGSSTTGTPAANADDLVIDKGASESGITLMSTAAASIRFGDAADTSIGSIEYNHTSNYMRFIINSAEKMRITSGGDITVSGGDLFLNSGTSYNDKGVVYLSNERTAIISDIVNLTANGDTSLDIQTRTTGSRTSSLFIDELKRVGINNNDPNNRLEISDNITTTGSTYLKISRGADATGVMRRAGIKLGNIASNDGSNWIVQASSDAGYFDDSILEFDHNVAGTATTRFAMGHTGYVGIGRLTSSYKLSLVSDSTVQNGVYISAGTGNSNHAFYVENQAGSAEHFAVRGDGQIRLNASRTGNILMGTTSLASIVGGSPVGSGFGMESNSRVVLFQGTTSTNAMTMQAFYNPNGQVGRIALDGSSTTYYTSSDYRLKEDLQDFNGLEKVSNIKVYDFKWKADESRSYGVIAHELEKIVPQAVGGEKDAEEMQMVDYSKIVPVLVKSIQELKAEVDSLKKQCNCK